MTSPTGTDVSAPSPPPSLSARFAERLRLWFERRRWLGEMANASALGRFDEVIKDAGMSRADLDVMIDAPSDAGRQFEALAEAEGIDLQELDPEVLREAIAVCVRCQYRAPCKRWLRTGIWTYGKEPRCPNAALLLRH